MSMCRCKPGNFLIAIFSELLTSNVNEGVFHDCCDDGNLEK
ncbi:hypothetical protein X975_21203, partial [Stegodyphus mimosarum]